MAPESSKPSSKSGNMSGTLLAQFNALQLPPAATVNDVVANGLHTFQCPELFKASSFVGKIHTMSLNPSLTTVLTIKESILHTLQNHALPASTRAAIIAPQLAIVNQWSDQIPLVLEPDVPGNANAIFAIRKDLYAAPQFTQCVLGVPATELPPAFSAFLSMILKLIGAQKVDKEKPVPKVLS